MIEHIKLVGIFVRHGEDNGVAKLVDTLARIGVRLGDRGTVDWEYYQLVLINGLLVLVVIVQLAVAAVRVSCLFLGKRRHWARELVHVDDVRRADGSYRLILGKHLVDFVAKELNHQQLP